MPATPAAGLREKIPPLSVGAALLFGAACVAYILSETQSYPPGLVTLWFEVGLPLLAGSAIIASLKFGFIEALPARALWVLMRPGPVAFGLIVAGMTFFLSVGFAYYIFDRAPTTADEVAQLWHAKMLLAGRLALPADPNPEFFAIDNVLDQGRWYSEYPIGGPAVLALGVLTKLPWILNPILAGATTATLYALMRRMYPEAQARAIAALFCWMPMVVFMSGSYMNHVPVLLFAVVALLALVEWERALTPKRRKVSAAIIGLAVGAAATIRPLDAMVVATCIGVFQLIVVTRDRSRIPEMLFTAAGGLVAIVPLLYANLATTGGATKFAYEVLWGDAHRIGFHMDPWGTDHTVARGVNYALWYINGMNLFATMWPVPVLVVAIIGLLSMKRATRWDALLLGLFWCQVVAYAAYWHKGHFVGPRFLYTATPTVAMLIARAPFLVGERYGKFARRTSVLFVFGCLVYAWGLPQQEFSTWGMARTVHETRQVVRADLDAVKQSVGDQRALIFVREPFMTRLVRRMWGLGMERSEATILSGKSDACALFDAVRAAENDSLAPSAKRLAIVRAAAPFVQSASSVRTKDPAVRMSSRSSVGHECLMELADDERLPAGAFGPALLQNDIDADGHITGNVVFVADIGERNERLRTRFGDRKWYRLSVTQSGTLLPQPRLEPY